MFGLISTSIENEEKPAQQPIDVVIAALNLEKETFPVVKFPREEVLAIYAHYRDELLSFSRGESAFDELSPPAQVVLDGLPQFKEAKLAAAEYWRDLNNENLQGSVINRAFLAIDKLFLRNAQNEADKIDRMLTHSFMWHLGATGLRIVEFATLAIGTAVFSLFAGVPPVISNALVFCASAFGMARLNSALHELGNLGEIRSEFDKKIHNSLTARVVAQSIAQKYEAANAESSDNFE